MDAFAKQHSQTQPTPWVSINWDIWEFEDDTSGLEISADLAELAMSSDEGVQVFNHVLNLLTMPQVIISTGNLDSRLQQWGTKYTTTGTQPTPSEEQYMRPDLHDAYVAPRNDIEERLAQVWSQLLGISGLGVYDSFFNLGGHSLLATQLMSQVREIFAVELSMRDFFESPTIADLAMLVVNRQLGDDVDEELLSRLIAEADDLSDDELHQLLSGS
jgi:acyl carrier protein